MEFWIILRINECCKQTGVCRDRRCTENRRWNEYIDVCIADVVGWCIGIGTDDFEKENLKAEEIDSRIGDFEKYKLRIRKTYK